MKLSQIGVKPLTLGTEVFCTHRASGVKNGSLRDVRAGAMAVRMLLWNHEAPAAPERPKRVSQPPDRLDNWVVAWPEIHYGLVVGLTYRAEGFHNPGWSSAFGYGIALEPPDPEPPTLEEVDRHPLYEVRWALKGKGALVPPWAAYPLGEHLVKFGGNRPIPVGHPEPVYLHDGIAFPDYATSVTAAANVVG